MFTIVVEYEFLIPCASKISRISREVIKQSFERSRINNGILTIRVPETKPIEWEDKHADQSAKKVGWSCDYCGDKYTGIGKTSEYYI